jgi:RsbT co-antagonist protein rsbRD N-terminal domain
MSCGPTTKAEQRSIPQAASRTPLFRDPRVRWLHPLLPAARHTDILKRWTQRIEREHVDKALTVGQLRDHSFTFLDDVLAALRSDADRPRGNPGSARDTSSAAHGAQRLRVGFDLVEVMREYEILAECIVEEVEVRVNVCKPWI